MTPEQEKYYENYFEMFSTKGWKQFVSDMKDEISDAHKKAFDGSEENFWMIKGSTEYGERVANFETILRSTYDHMGIDEQESPEDFN